MPLIKWLALLSLVTYLAALGILTLAQRNFLYFPRGPALTPGEAGLPRGEATAIETDDGERLHAWFVPPAERRPLILYFHGNGGALADRIARFRTLTKSGVGLLAVEYRGYPGSTGTTTEAGLHRDAEAAYRDVLGRGVTPQRLIIMGESLGTGVAVALAARHECAALVLDSPYSSVADVAAAHYWMFPVRPLLRDPFRSDLKIDKVRAPILMVHGSADQIIPLRFAEKLFALAPEPKRFLRIDGAGHLAMDSVLPQVLEWIGATVG